REMLVKPDADLAHAAMQFLRRADKDRWPLVLALLDVPDTEAMRALALRAVADRYEPSVVDDLITRLAKDDDPAHRREYADTLTRLYKKPGPWVYWGYRPAPRPAHTTAWERSAAIEEAINGALADANEAVRLAVLRRTLRERVPTRLATLGRWLRATRDADSV